MKFLLIVLAIHFAAEVITGKGKEKKGDERKVDERVMHPAEFGLRG